MRDVVLFLLILAAVYTLGIFVGRKTAPSQPHPYTVNCVDDPAFDGVECSGYCGPRPKDMGETP